MTGKLAVDMDDFFRSSLGRKQALISLGEKNGGNQGGIPTRVQENEGKKIPLNRPKNSCSLRFVLCTLGGCVGNKKANEVFPLQRFWGKKRHEVFSVFKRVAFRRRA